GKRGARKGGRQRNGQGMANYCVSLHLHSPARRRRQPQLSSARVVSIREQRFPCLPARGTACREIMVTALNDSTTCWRAPARGVPRPAFAAPAPGSSPRASPRDKRQEFNLSSPYLPILRVTQLLLFVNSPTKN